MTSISATELAGFKDKFVVVQVDIQPTGDDDETFREVTGKCVESTPDGMVIQSKKGTEIIPFKSILDVEVVEQRRTNRITRRYIEPAKESNVRQHLADRHGLPYDLVRSLSAGEALLFHGVVDHGTLGHEHGPKPPGRPGRPTILKTEMPGITLTPAPEDDDIEDDSLDSDDLEELVAVDLRQGGQRKKISRLVRRYVEQITEANARQHMLDRHGLPLKVARSLTSAEAMMFHSMADHTKLGHSHDPKPTTLLKARITKGAGQ